MRKSLFRQIYVYFIIVIILSLTGVGLVSYYQSSKALEEQVEKYISQLIQYSTAQTESQLQRYELATDSILSEESVKTFLEMDPKDSYQFYELTKEIQKNVFQKTFIAYPHVHMIYLLGDHGKAILDDNQNLVSAPYFDPVSTLQYYNSRVPSDGKIAIFRSKNSKEETITIARRIRGFTSYKPKGVLVMEIKVDQLVSLWDAADLGHDTYFFILDENGDMVYRPEFLQFNADGQFKIIDKIMNEQDVSFVEWLGEKQQLFVSRESDYLGWRMVVFLPVNELRRPISTIQTTTLSVGLLTLLVALIIAYRFGQSIIRPIRKMKEGMQETEKGNWNRIDGDIRDDEIGGLIHRYNLMVSRLREMIEKVYEVELNQQKSQLELEKNRYKRQSAEFQALQLQINPHFLYNTLETINCYAIVQDSDEITEIVEAMAYMLRYSVQTDLEEIKLVNELNHVRNYMIVMQHRLEISFEIDVDVPEDLLLRKMVRLTMQPLVENAFQHAFKRGIAPYHTIRIHAEETGEHLLVTVEDNGVGIPEEKLVSLRGQLHSPREEKDNGPEGTTLHRGGIGIINVHRRIQMVYGEDYGLLIESQEGAGSRFIMKMPKEQAEYT